MKGWLKKILTKPLLTGLPHDSSALVRQRPGAGGWELFLFIFFSLYRWDFYANRLPGQN